MTVDGPPAFDASTFSAVQAQLLASQGSYYTYSGEMAISLIRSNSDDSGYITGSTFQGGTIELFGGPWTVTGNTVLGATADTFSPGAFGLHNPHDVLLENNTVTQADPLGTEFRLVVLASAGIDNTFAGNSFGGGAGSVGNELTYNAASDQYSGINDPEVVLAESSAGVLFEGRPSAISADGYLLVLTNLRAGAGGPLVPDRAAGEPDRRRHDRVLDANPSARAAGRRLLRDRSHRRFYQHVLYQ
jgi:hypothetical protein